MLHNLKTYLKTAALSVIISLNFNIVQADEFISIGTGGVTGVYYPAGGAICRLVNRNRKNHGIRCSVESTAGSIFNLNALENQNLDAGVVQSDLQYQAYYGTGHFANDLPRKNLRTLFSLHTEVFTIAARADSGIKTLDDLVNKRVNIGTPGSGQRATMEVIMKAKGWDKNTFKLASELKASEQAQAVCDNKIDAMIYASGHPNGAIQEVTTSCETVIVEVSGPEIDEIVENHSYYAYAVIPGGMYVGNNEDVNSFGVKATLLTTSEVSDNIAYEVVKAVFDNFDSFKNLHPVFQTLRKEDLIYGGNTAPLHPGAEKYYREKGLLPTANKSN
jgi:TRAP transporter TAXI family solute receptor